MKSTILHLILFFLVGKFSIVNADEQSTISNAIVYNDHDIYFITANSVRVRSTTDGNAKILGELSLNDKIRIINPTIVYNLKFIEVSIVETYDPIVKSEKYFVSTEYLSPTLVDYKAFIGKYFVVVNVATETIRLYERVCPDNSCPNRMVFESEVVVGEDVDHPRDEKGKGRSILGSYRITGWSKFYQDAEGHYPAWYRDGYPETPGPDAKWNAWFSKSVLPVNDEGKKVGMMRGAFGWYTAFVAPASFGQWTHGTLGWGSDKDKFIQRVKKPLINVISDPRSSGCTRNNNETIAFLRKMVEIGAPIIKIYAKEEILDPSMKDYPNQTLEWKYALTKNLNHSIDRTDVLKFLKVSSSDLDSFWEAKRNGGSVILDPASPINQILEVGSYQMDAHPDVITYTPGDKLSKMERKIGRKGNVYGIKDKEMHGVYYIDAGVMENYAHPDSVVETGGFSDEVTPGWMMKSNLK